MPAPFPAVPTYTGQGVRYPSSTYPPQGPQVQGTGITVDQFLQDPLRVYRTIMDLTAQRFIADRIFSQGGTATGGAVVYDQVLLNDLYLQRNVQAIKPGSEFPVLTDTSAAPMVARTTKWGGSVIVTYEERDRDRRDILNRELTKLRNTIVRQVDGVAVATLRAAPVNTATASSSWSTSTSAMIKDLAACQTTVDKLDMGYVLTDALISPTTRLNLTTNAQLQQQIYYSRGALMSPLGQNLADPTDVLTLLGMRFWTTNRVTDNEVFLLAGQTAGAISDETPLYTRVIDQPEKERMLIQAGRRVVPYVTDPKSVVYLTGVQ